LLRRFPANTRLSRDGERVLLGGEASAAEGYP